MLRQHKIYPMYDKASAGMYVCTCVLPWESVPCCWHRERVAHRFATPVNGDPSDSGCCKRTVHVRLNPRGLTTYPSRFPSRPPPPCSPSFFTPPPRPLQLRHCFRSVLTPKRCPLDEGMATIAPCHRRVKKHGRTQQHHNVKVFVRGALGLTDSLAPFA